MKTTQIIVLMSLVLTITLSGCNGKREINELALVMAVGLDKGTDGKVEVSVQIARPADSRGQTGAPAGNTGDPIWSAKASGDTIFEAIRNLSSFSTRRVFWAHNYIIIINEDLAREGIKDIIDFFTRNPELRMRTWVVVTPNKASNILSTMTGLEVISGEAMDKLFRYSNISNLAPRTQMLDLQAAFLSESTEPVLARVKLIARGISNKKPGQEGSVKQIELAGAGVFKGDKLVGILNQKETRGLLPFIEKIESGVMAISCPKEPNKMVSLELKNYKFKVTPSFKKNQPRFHIRFAGNYTMVEAGCPLSLEDEAQIAKLEKQVEDELTGNINSVVSKAQSEYKADILELGKVFHNRYPSEWKHSIMQRWKDVFQTAPVTVEVSVKINDSALLYKPTKEGK
ncbi:Ger(x)C family spore germination protein [Bacillus marasmi]|uniref:Ger(x)C family spore germination protein n=1 Tax=Bacillus marasmi TaxID=1926279 RepID=UPI001FE72AFA|nr:Ger(x)C family spore germination protein [Bacillus marasmi]